MKFQSEVLVISYFACLIPVVLSQESVRCYYCNLVSNPNVCYQLSQYCYGQCATQKRYYTDGLVLYSKGCKAICIPGNITTNDYIQQTTCCPTSWCNTEGMSPRSSNGWMVLGIITGIFIGVLLAGLIIAWMCANLKCCKQKRTRQSPDRQMARENQMVHNNVCFEMNEAFPATAPPYTEEDVHPPPSYEEIVVSTAVPAGNTSDQETVTPSAAAEGATLPAYDVSGTGTAAPPGGENSTNQDAGTDDGTKTETPVAPPAKDAASELPAPDNNPSD